MSELELKEYADIHNLPPTDTIEELERAVVRHMRRYASKLDSRRPLNFDFEGN